MYYQYGAIGLPNIKPEEKKYWNAVIVLMAPLAISITVAMADSRAIAYLMIISSDMNCIIRSIRSQGESSLDSSHLAATGIKEHQYPT